MSAKQNRPIGQYLNQFEDPTPGSSINFEEFARTSQGLPPTEDPGPKKPFHEYLKPKEGPSGAAIEEYQRELRKSISQGGLASGISTPGGIDPSTAEGLDFEKDVIGKSEPRLIWNALQRGIDEIQVSTIKGKMLETNFKMRDITKLAETEGRELSDSEKDEINGYTEDLNELKVSLESNEAELKASEDVLGKYYIAKIEHDKSNDNSISDGWLELADRLGGSMSEIQAMVATTGLSVASSMATASLTAGATTWYTGGGALAAMIVVGAGAGLSALVQNYSRRQESYAEMEEAYSSRIASEKRKYRIANNGLEMPDEMVAQLEDGAISGAREVYDQNMNLFATDIAEVALAFAMPWSRLKDLGSTQALKYVYRAGIGATGFGVGALWEGREEGDQYLIKQKYLTGEYDGGLGFFEGAYSSLGVAGTTIQGMGVNAYNGAFDYQYMNGRTNSKEFKNSVASGMEVGAVMGGAHTTAGLVVGQGKKALDRRRFGLEAEELSKQLYDRIVEVEQNKVMSEWLFKKFAEPGGANRIGKVMKAVYASMPEIAERMSDKKLIAQTLHKAEQYYKGVNGKRLEKLDGTEKLHLFQAFMSLDQKVGKDAELVTSSEEKLVEALSNLEAPTTEKLQGMPELIALKARIKAVKDSLKALKTEDVSSSLHHGNLNASQREYFSNLIKGKKEESLEGLEAAYKKMLVEYGHNTGAIKVPSDVQVASRAVENAKAMHYATSAAKDELTFQTALGPIGVRNNGYFMSYSEAVSSSQREENKKEPVEVLPDMDQTEDPAVGDMVAGKDASGKVVVVGEVVSTTADEDGNITTIVRDEESGEEVTVSDAIHVTPTEEVDAALAAEKARIDNEAEKKRKEEEKKKKKEKKDPFGLSEDDDDVTVEEEVEETTPEEEEEDPGAVEGAFDLQENPNPTEAAENDTETPAPQASAPISFLDLVSKIKGVFYAPAEIARIPEAYTKWKNELLFKLFTLFKNESGHTPNSVRIKATFRIKQTGAWSLESSNDGRGKKKIAKGAPLTDEELAKLPIEILIEGLDGVDVITYRDVDATSQEEADNIIKFARKVYQASLKGQTVAGSIEVAAQFAVPNSHPGERFPISTLFPSSEIVIGVTTDGNTVGDGVSIAGTIKGDVTNIGRAYAIVYVPTTGYSYPVKLNQRGLNAMEIDELVALLQHLQENGGQWAYGETDLLNTQYLSYLVNSYSSHGQAQGKQTPLIVTGKKGAKIEYGTNLQVLDFKNPKSVAAFKAWAEKNLKRHVSKYLLGKTLSKDFTFLGVEYTKGQSYTEDFLTGNNSTNVDDHVISTDILLDELESPVTFYPDNSAIGLTVDPLSLRVDEGEVPGTQSVREKEAAKEKGEETAPTEETTDDNSGVKKSSSSLKDVLTGSSVEGGIEDTDISNEGEDDINDFDINMEVGEEGFPTPDPETSSISVEKATANFRKIVGDSIPLSFQKSLLKIAESGAFAYGVFRKAAVILSEMAPAGAEFHEAYHVIEELWLPQSQRDQLDAETKRKYGKAPQSEVDKILEKYKKFNISSALAESLYYSELRAEDYRIYAKSGETLSFGQKTLRWFKSLKAGIKFLFNSKEGFTADLMFSRMSNGFYAKRAPISSRVAMWQQEKGLMSLTMQKIGVSPRTIQQTVNSLLYVFVNISEAAGGIGGMMNITNVSDLPKLNKKTFVSYLKSQIRKATENGEINQARVLSNILGTEESSYTDGILDDILVEMRIKLLQIGIKQTEMNPEEGDSQVGKDVHKATKDPFETSGKDNATTNTRFLFQFLVKYDENGNKVVNAETGLPVIENASRVWNTVEAALSNIVTHDDDSGTTIYAYDRMIGILRMLAESDKTFEALYQTVVDKLSENERTQFFNAFSKSSNNFLTAIYSEFEHEYDEGQSVTESNFRFIDPAQFSKKYRIRERWLDKLRDSKLYVRTLNSKGEESFTANSDLAEELLIEWNVLAKEIQTRNGKLTLQDYKGLQKFLSNFSIFVSVEGLRITMEGYAQEVAVKARSRKQDPKAMGVAKFMSEVGRLATSDKIIYSLVKVAAKKGKLLTAYRINEEGEREGPKVEYDLFDNNPLKGESSLVLKLAEAEAFFGDDYDQTTVLRAEGKSVWVYSLNNYFKKRSTEFEASNSAVKQLMAVPFHKGSLLLDYLLAKNPLTYRTFNVLNNKAGENSITEYKDLTSPDEYLLRLNMVLNAIYSPPTMADKGVWIVYKGPEYISKEGIQQIVYDPESDTYQFPKEVMHVFTDYIASEYARMRQTRLELFGTTSLKENAPKTSEPWADNELVEYYHYNGLDKEGKPIRSAANGLKSQLFSFLNDPEILKSLKLQLNDDLLEGNMKELRSSQVLQELIAEMLTARLKKELETAQAHTIVSNNANGLTLKGVSSASMAAYASQGDSVDIRTRKVFAAFTLNSIIAGVETMKTFAGDPAYYKSMEEMQKRMPALIAPGQDLDLRTEADKFFRAAALRDSGKASRYYDKYLAAFTHLNKVRKLGLTQKQIKEILSPYENVDRTDAQGYITLERWRFLMQKLGKWNQGKNKEMDAAYNRLKDGVATSADMKWLAAMPMKGMHFELRPYKGLMIPTYFKYSQAILFPQLVAGSKELSALYDDMNAKNIDEAVFMTGIKVGAQSPIGFNEDGSIDLNNVMQLENKYWKLQQEVQPHTASSQLEGSQVKRNILANIKLDEYYTLDGEDILGKDIIQYAHDIDRELSDMGKEELLTEFGIVERENNYVIADYTKLQKALIEHFLADGKKTTKKLLESLELNASKTGFLRPLHSHPFAEEIDLLLGSIITKRTVKLKMPGGSFVQMSSFGYERTNRFSQMSEKDKKMVEMVTNPNPLNPTIYSDGKVIKAQILLPYYFKDLIPGIKDSEKMSQEAISKYIKDNRLLQGIAYRIPNQGMSSIDSFEVVGFLPRSMGDTIVAYDDITAKTGSDFDIDKMYIMLPSYAKTEEGELFYVDYKEHKDSTSKSMRKKALQNRKLEIYAAIVDDEKTFIDSITPLDAIAIKYRAAVVRAMEKYYLFTPQEKAELENFDKASQFDSYIKLVGKVMNRKENLEWFSPSYQIEVKQSFIGGKFGVGQEARPLVDHPLSQAYALQLSHNMKIGLRNGRKSILSGTYNVAKGLITNVMSARLNAYVDIAKDPYIFYINNNSITANTVALLDRLGADPAWTDFFMSQPILKDFVEYSYFNSSDTTEKVIIAGKMQSSKQLTLNKYKRMLESSLAADGIENSTEVASEMLASIKPKYILDSFKDIAKTIPVSELRRMLQGQHTTQDIITQIKLFHVFEAYKTQAVSVNKLISASKQDVEGAGGGMANVIVSEAQFSKAMNDRSMQNQHRRFVDTMLGKYRENSVLLMKRLLSPHLAMGSPAFMAAYFKIQQAMQKDTIFEDPTFLRKIHKDLYGIYMAKKIEDLNAKKAKDLLFGENDIFKRFQYWQNSSESLISHNGLIRALVLKRALTKDGLGEIRFISGEVDPVDMNRLSDSWEELFSHPDEQVREFAKDLATYSFLVDGKGRTLYGFSSLMPLSFEDEFFSRASEEKNSSIDENGLVISDLENRELFSTIDIETVIRNNSDLPGIAPKVGKNTLVSKTIHEISVNGVRQKVITTFETADIRIRKEVKDKDSDDLEGFSVPKFVQHGGFLYRYVGNSVKGTNPVYVLTTKKGFSERGTHIFEPFGFENTSILPSNRLEANAGVPITDAKLAALISFNSEVYESLSEREKKIYLEDKFLQTSIFKTGKVEELAMVRATKEEQEEYGSFSEDDYENGEEEDRFSPGEGEDIYQHLETTLEKEINHEVFLVNAASGIKEKYSGATLSEITVRKLRARGVTKEEIQAFENYLKANHYDFRGKTIETLALFRFDQYMQSHRDTLKELGVLSQKADKTLDNFLIEYLSEFNVEITEMTIEEMEQRYGIGRIGIADTLKKIIHVANNRNITVFPEEFSHMLIDLVGANSEVMRPLIDNITKWEKYQEIVVLYRNDPLYKNADGTLNTVKLRKEAAGQLLAEAIVLNNARKQPKGFFLETATAVFNRILDVFSGIKGVKTLIPAQLLANRIANDVLAGKKDFIERYTRAQELQFQERSYEDSLASFPRAAKALSTIIEKLGAVLVGSLAIRAQGIVMRPGSETIHDLDFRVPKSVTGNFETASQVYDWIDTTVKPILPNFHPIYIWGRGKNAKYTVNGVITDYPYIAKKFRELKGNFNQRMDKMTPFEQENIILIDFFMNQDATVEVTDKGHSNWVSIMEAKLSSTRGLARDKDYYDLRRFKPYDGYTEELTLRDSEFVYANLARGNIIKIAQEEIQKGTTQKGPLRNWHKAVFSNKHMYGKAVKFLEDINNRKFNGGQVLKLTQNPAGPIGQLKVSIRPEYYIPPPGNPTLFDENPFDKQC